MRNIGLLAAAILLLTPACFGPRTYFPEYPPAGAIGIAGRRAPVPPPPPRPEPAIQCAEVSRVPCDFLHCGAIGYDFVSVRCLGKAGVTARCEQNSGCKGKSGR